MLLEKVHGLTVVPGQQPASPVEGHDDRGREGDGDMFLWSDDCNCCAWKWPWETSDHHVGIPAGFCTVTPMSGQTHVTCPKNMLYFAHPFMTGKTYMRSWRLLWPLTGSRSDGLWACQSALPWRKLSVAFIPFNTMTFIYISVFLSRHIKCVVLPQGGFLFLLSCELKLHFMNFVNLLCNTENINIISKCKINCQNFNLSTELTIKFWALENDTWFYLSRCQKYLFLWSMFCCITKYSTYYRYQSSH